MSDEHRQCVIRELRVYTDNFGSRKGDNCLVADLNGKVVGVVWTRVMNDYGHVDDDTPSFAISLYEKYRGWGIGSQLMVSLAKMTGTYVADILDNDVIKLSESIENYKQGYCEVGMNRTKEMVYNEIKKNNRIHIDEIAKNTGLSKSMVNVRVKTLKQWAK